MQEIGFKTKIKTFFSLRFFCKKSNKYPQNYLFCFDKSLLEKDTKKEKISGLLELNKSLNFLESIKMYY